MDLGLRQSDVANRFQVSTSTVNYWENNRFNPEVRYVPVIVTFLGFDPFDATRDGFAVWLKAVRIAAGLTRRQLAAQIGVHPGTVADWERGEAKPREPSIEQLKAVLGRSFDVDR